MEPWMVILGIFLIGVIGIAVYTAVAMRPDDWG